MWRCGILWWSEGNSDSVSQESVWIWSWQLWEDCSHVKFSRGSRSQPVVINHHRPRPAAQCRRDVFQQPRSGALSHPQTQPGSVLPAPCCRGKHEDIAWNTRPRWYSWLFISLWVQCQHLCVCSIIPTRFVLPAVYRCKDDIVCDASPSVITLLIYIYNNGGT